MINSEQTLNLAMPKGELFGNTMSALRMAGYEIPDPKGKQLFVNVENAPIKLLIGRASDVPSEVFSAESVTPAGITGSDILWERGYDRGQVGTTIPTDVFFPEQQTPELYLGVTKKFAAQVQADEGKLVEPTDIKGIIATKFPLITNDYLKDNGISPYSVRVWQSNGSIEAMPYFYPDCNTIVDVWVSGNTAKDNGILKARTIAQVSTRLFEATRKIRPTEQRILDDMRERIAVAAEKRKTPTTDLL